MDVSPRYAFIPVCGVDERLPSHIDAQIDAAIGGSFDPFDPARSPSFEAAAHDLPPETFAIDLAQDEPVTSRVAVIDIGGGRYGFEGLIDGDFDPRDPVDPDRDVALDEAVTTLKPGQMIFAL